jgi:CHAT domain-containing protein
MPARLRLPLALAAATLVLGGAARAQEQTAAQSCSAPREEQPSPDPAVAALQRGNRLAAEGRSQEALASYDESRSLALARGDAALATRAAANRVRAAIDAGQGREVAGELEELAAAAQDLPAPEGTRLLIHVARSQERLAEHDGVRPARRRAAQLLQEAFEQAQQAGQTRLASYALGYLAELHEREGQLDPALELDQAALLAALEADAPDAIFHWRWQAGRIHARAGRSERALAAYRQAAVTLVEIRERAALAGAAWSSVLGTDTDEFYVQFVDQLLRRAAATGDAAGRQALLVEARDTLEARKADELRDYFRDECLAALRQAAPEEIPGTAVVYPVVLPDRLELIVGGAGRLTSIVSPVDRETLTAEVREFRRTLPRQTTREYLRPARALYGWLIRPIEGELGQIAPRTLVFVPDGPLRTIPFSALVDADTGQFLVERYPIAIVPSLTLTDPRPLPRGGIQLLAAGLSQAVDGFPPLVFVDSEIAALREEYPGRTLLNEQFEVARFEDAVESRPFGIVHIASHAEFADDPSQSFLLAYDGKISMDQLARSIGTTRFRATQPLELLTLSACETAAGNDRAALGLAGIALRAGARSALATLWSVNDQSSTELVTGFYRALADPEVSRAEALRLAQLELLAQRGTRHPAFWSAFVLISSWL